MKHKNIISVEGKNNELVGWGDSVSFIITAQSINDFRQYDVKNGYCYDLNEWLKE